jgi:hypothetical protein
MGWSAAVVTAVIAIIRQQAVRVQSRGALSVCELLLDTFRRE